MKTPKKTRKTTILATLGGIIILMAATFLAYQYIFAVNNQSGDQTSSESPDASRQINNDTPSQDQINNGTDIKKETISNAEGTTSNDLQVTITSFSKGPTVTRIEVTTPSILATGNCSLTLRKADSIVTYTADLQALAQYSVCKGFDIPASIGAGSWNAEASVTAGAKQGAAEAKVEITP